MTERSAESNLAFRLTGRVQQLVECRKHVTQIGVVTGDPLLDLIELGGEFGVATRQRTQSDESPHNEHARLDCARALQYRGHHDRAMLRECPRERPRETQAREVVTVCDHLDALRPRQPESEVARESSHVTPHRLIEGLRRDAVDDGQVRIQDDLLTSNRQDSGVDEAFATGSRQRGHVCHGSRNQANALCEPVSGVNRCSPRNSPGVVRRNRNVRAVTSAEKQPILSGDTWTGSGAGRPREERVQMEVVFPELAAVITGRDLDDAWTARCVDPHA
jgi:hypothetical protein